MGARDGISGKGGMADSNGVGNVFSVGVNGTGFQNLLSFTGTRGAAPGAKLRRRLARK
jgi:hypothetical protein